MPVPTPADIAKVFPLEHPVTLKGVLYSELQARRPKVKDLKVLTMNAEKDAVGAYNRFLAGITTTPLEVVDELDLADYGKIRDWLADFLPKSADATS